YDGSGSMEIANWCRAVLTIDQKAPGVFKLIAGKRGRRLHWTDAAGNPTEERLIRHGDDGLIYWQDASPEDLVPAKTGFTYGLKAKEDVLALVQEGKPVLKSTVIDLAQQCRIGSNKARGFIDELTEAGKLHELHKAREGKRPLVYLAREPSFPDAAENADK